MGNSGREDFYFSFFFLFVVLHYTLRRLIPIYGNFKVSFNDNESQMKSNLEPDCSVACSLIQPVDWHGKSINNLLNGSNSKKYFLKCLFNIPVSLQQWWLPQSLTEQICSSLATPATIQASATPQAIPMHNRIQATVQRETYIPNR